VHTSHGLVDRCPVAAGSRPRMVAGSAACPGRGFAYPLGLSVAPTSSWPLRRVPRSRCRARFRWRSSALKR
jgi:hypothetical protein